MKFVAAIVIALELNWAFGELRRIERRTAHVVQEDEADAPIVGSGSDVGILSVKEHQDSDALLFQGSRLLAPTPKCTKQNTVECVDGMTSDGMTCAEACGIYCCNGTEACDGFTGSICKDGDTSFAGSCSSVQACKNAKIDLVYKSCVGAGACADAGSNEGFIGEIVNSCFQQRACKSLGSNGGYVGSVLNSCDGGQACLAAAGYDNDFGFGAPNGTIKLGISSSCNAIRACYGAAAGGYAYFIESACTVDGACEGLAPPPSARRLQKVKEDVPPTCVNSCCNAVRECYGATLDLSATTGLLVKDPTCGPCKKNLFSG